MGCYVIAVGGTGNKILESLVYAACADVFGGVSHLDMLSVDVDASCGNTTRAKRAAECYQNVREALETWTVWKRARRRIAAFTPL